MNIIADIAGQSDALKRLHQKMPSGETWCLGDLVDRGPDSKGVIDYLISKNIKSLLGNHDHFLLEHAAGKSPYWLPNGGGATIKSYGFEGEHDFELPKDHLDWLSGLPLYHKTDSIFLSHAPWKAKISLERAASIYNETSSPWGDPLNGYSLIWCREEPEPRDQLLQVFGHNSHWGLAYFCTDAEGNPDGSQHSVDGSSVVPCHVKDAWAICLDQSRLSVVTGLHIPTMTIYTEPYETTN